MSSTDNSEIPTQPGSTIGLQPLSSDGQQTYLANDHRGVGDQHVGPLTDLRTRAQNVGHVVFSPPASHKTIVLVVILAIVGTVLGIVLGRNDNTNENNHVSASPSSTPSIAQSTPATTLSPTTNSQSPMSTTSASTTECQYSCDQAYVETVGCVSHCPGASCLDDTGCSDPWPCISNTCCYTGCSPGWSCIGVCSTTDTMNLVCVSNTNSSITYASTCLSVSSTPKPLAQ
ncbi:hypothetical protein F5Y16DRAFT_392575 [Xylariaceae sp. FL0255]|nr:hypothetical protein F5Y16DRAFT_392575 [Xylariaceae sp. FL0255]